MERVLVTGGAGYVGCVLIPMLLEAGHRVTVYDLMLYGTEGLRLHNNLKTVQGDIRDTKSYAEAVEGHDVVIHLASISNDPCFDLKPDLGRAINYECFGSLVLRSKQAGVSRFIYASSSSVYGVSDAAEVTEEHPLVPLTDYNRYKGLCEPVLEKHRSPGFTTVTVRPATVCGVSPRMRFDLTVNIFANQAINTKEITVFGGNQKRPNIHIEDLATIYLELIKAPMRRIDGEIFNAGHENCTVAEIAERVRRVVEQEMPDKKPIRITTSNFIDARSYHICSRKLTECLGVAPQRTIEDAVRGMCAAFKEGRFPNSLTDERYVNVRVLKNKKVA